jgi:alkylation response protein AidB-like acyl-CoA dehydrogenase
VLAAHLAAGQGDAGKARAILEGGARVGLAIAAAKAGDCYLLAAQQADLLLIVDKGRLALVPAADAADRVTRDPLDGTVDLQRAVLRPGEAAAARLTEAGYDRFLVLLAAYQLGIAEAALRVAVEYSKLREQFGRPIGAFQSIKHLCADARMRNEAAQFQTIYAGLASHDGHDDARAQALSALIVAEQAAILNAEAAIQIHGGMGFTDECTAHLFLKRARLMSRLGGGQADLLDKLAALS